MICVDASVAFKCIVVENHSEHARRLFRDAMLASEQIVAPHLLRFELTNSVRQRMVRAGVPLPNARDLIARLIALPVTLLTFDQLHPRALEIADTYGLPAAYDAHYVALAELLVCDFWTADDRLVRRLSPGLPFVRAIGDYPTA